MDTTENSDSNDITHILIWLLGYKTCDIFRKNFLIDFKPKCEQNVCLFYVLALHCTGDSINIPP